MGDVQKGDAQFLLHALQFQLHLLTQLQIQRAQGLVQQEHLRLVDQRAGDGDALLLATGKRLHGTLFVALHFHEAQHAVHALGDLRLGQFAQLEAEGDVVKDVQMGEKGVFLKDGVHAAAVRRHVGDVLVLKEDAALSGHLEAADNAQHGGLAAAGGAEQRDELTLADVKVDIVKHLRVAKTLGHAAKLNQTLLVVHGAHPPW